MALTIDDLAKMIQETRTYLGEKLNASLTKIQELSDISESRLTNLEAKLELLTKENFSLKQDLTCNNLIIHGVIENANETEKLLTETVMTLFNFIKVDDVEIESIYRLDLLGGEKRKIPLGKTSRPVKVKFLTEGDRNRVLSNANLLKDIPHYKNILIREDLPVDTRKIINLKKAKTQIAEEGQREEFTEDDLNADDEKYLVNEYLKLINMEENKCKTGTEQVGTSRDNLEKKVVNFIADGHALMNVVILSNILQHLEYDDIQSFRLVCGRWNQVSEPLFWKVSRISILNRKYERDASAKYQGRDIESVEDSNSRLIKSFENTFPSSDFPTNEIAFAGCINHAALDYFLKERGSMTLTNIYFRPFWTPSKIFTDLNHYMTSNITTLHVKEFNGCEKPMRRVSLDVLTNIKDLHLENCEIVLNGKIAPRKLNLYDTNSVSYKGKTYKLEKNYGRDEGILINEFFDFSNIKILRLRGSILMLDVGSSIVDLEAICIDNIKVIGLVKSQWTTNRFDFNSNICFGDKIEVKLISGLGNVVFDPQTLPISIEKLVFSNCINTNAPMIFLYPNLKSLELKTYKYDQFPILDFTSCTSLVNFDLTATNDHQRLKFDKIKFPRIVKRVKLCNVFVDTYTPWQLDTLILVRYKLCYEKTYLQYFNTVKLAIHFDFDDELRKETNKNVFLNFWKNNNVQQLAIGRIGWSRKNPFLHSEFSKIVDKKGNYFLFTKTNGIEIGEAIDYEVFHKLCTLNT